MAAVMEYFENLENIYLTLLGLGLVFIVLKYSYSAAHKPKKSFKKPIKYVEVRSWREK